MKATAKIALAGVVLFAAGLALGWLATRQMAVVPHDVSSIAIYDDWRLACPAPGGKDACVARQDVVDGKTGAHVAVLSLTGTTLTVTVPYNLQIASQLSRGVVDGVGAADPRSHLGADAGLRRQPSCWTPQRAPLLRQADHGRILFARMDKQAVQVSFSLRGFARADDAAHRAAGIQAPPVSASVLPLAIPLLALALPAFAQRPPPRAFFCAHRREKLRRLDRALCPRRAAALRNVPDDAEQGECAGDQHRHRLAAAAEPLRPAGHDAAGRCFRQGPENHRQRFRLAANALSAL